MQQQRLPCPLCGQMDMVRNVSVIVNEQKPFAQRTHSGAVASGALRVFGGALVITATMLSVLGGVRFLLISRRRRSRSQGSTPQMLLSERLAFPSHPISGLLDALSQPLLLVLGLGIGFIVADVFIMKASMASMLADPFYQKVILLGSIGTGIFLLFTAIRIWILIKDKPRRDRAYAVWQQLYYCYRDDVVFVAQAPARWAYTAHMRRLLHY